MSVSIGTFNLNNLFSRFNFRAKVDDSPSVSNGGLTLTFESGDIDVRTFMGRLVKEKDVKDTGKIATRILDTMNADVLAVQEVEHIEILKQFNRDHLGGAYSEIVLIEGNDPRLIDVGLMSKLPIGAITSWQAIRHPDRPGQRVFGRDLLEIDILDANGDRLLTVYNTHMKSHYVPFNEDPVAGAAAANARRRQQADMTRTIINARQSPQTPFVLLGDMNDGPDSAFLAPMLDIAGQSLVNGLANAVETRPPKPESANQGPGPQTRNWTHRYNPSGPAFPEYAQYDQIWLSPALVPALQSAHIDRRKTHGGDGSDHDPAWVVLDI